MIARALIVACLLTTVLVASAPAEAAACQVLYVGGAGVTVGWTEIIAGAVVGVRCVYGDVREIPGHVLP